MEINMKDYEEWKEKVSKQKAEISKADLIKVCSRIANAASEQENETAGILNASIEMLKVLDEFFPEKKEEEKEDKAAEEPQEEKSTEKDSKYDDLKNRIFNHAADYMSPIAPTVESLSAAEIRRSAKYTALLLLILDAGLSEEYHDWMREKGYE